jgi:hypothetical protein
MLRVIGRVVALSVVLAHAGSAMALVDAQVLVGRRWYDYKPNGGTKQGVASQEVGVAVHVDPIPLVPVSFGTSVVSGSPSKDDLKVDQAAVMQVFGEVMAWVPMVPFVTPYVRVRYPVQGAWTSKKANVVDETSGTPGEVVATNTIAGPQISLGAKIPVLPMIKLLVEAGQGIETYKSKELKFAGEKRSSNDNGDLASKSVVLGVEVGL